MAEINIKDNTLNEFFDAIMMLNGKEELQRFFEDVCTMRELHSISQRLEVAKLLKIRKTYSEIEKDTGASTATISRVTKRCSRLWTCTRYFNSKKFGRKKKKKTKITFYPQTLFCGYFTMI